MTTTKLINQVRGDRKEQQTIQSATSTLNNRVSSGSRPSISGYGIPDIPLKSGLTVSESLRQLLEEVEEHFAARIIRNNKILATADALVRGLALGSQDHEPA